MSAKLFAGNHSMHVLSGVATHDHRFTTAKRQYALQRSRSAWTQQLKIHGARGPTAQKWATFKRGHFAQHSAQNCLIQLETTLKICPQSNCTKAGLKRIQSADPDGPPKSGSEEDTHQSADPDGTPM